MKAARCLLLALTLIGCSEEDAPTPEAVHITEFPSMGENAAVVDGTSGDRRWYSLLRVLRSGDVKAINACEGVKLLNGGDSWSDGSSPRYVIEVGKDHAVPWLDVDVCVMSALDLRMLSNPKGAFDTVASPPEWEIKRRYVSEDASVTTTAPLKRPLEVGDKVPVQ